MNLATYSKFLVKPRVRPKSDHAIKILAEYLATAVVAVPQEKVASSGGSKSRGKKTTSKAQKRPSEEGDYEGPTTKKKAKK